MSGHLRRQVQSVKLLREKQKQMVPAQLGRSGGLYLCSSLPRQDVQVMRHDSDLLPLLLMVVFKERGAKY